MIRIAIRPPRIGGIGIDPSLVVVTNLGITFITEVINDILKVSKSPKYIPD